MKKKIVPLALFGILAGLALTNTVRADSIRQTDVSEASKGNSLVEVRGTFITDTKAILDQVNGYRQEACREGVKDPNDGHALTMADYVPIEWSGDLEEIAQTRAAEASICMSHTRPNGTSCFSCNSSSGEQSWGEVLAWSGGNETPSQALSQWYSEKSDYVNNTPGAVTGHYTQMIDPKNIRMGMGIFDGAAAGEFSFKQLTTGEKGASGETNQVVEVQNKDLRVAIPGEESVTVNNKVKMDYDLAYQSPEYWDSTESEIIVYPHSNSVDFKSDDTNIATIDNKGWLTGVNEGQTVVSASYGDLTSECDVSVIQAVPMYRVYNSNSGEHFYTGNVKEKNHLVSLGWKDEGIGWKAPKTSNTPVYRLYNKRGGEHHYTMKMEERDNLIRSGWKDEGIGWWSDDSYTVPVYRQYNLNAFANNHNYTTNAKEKDHLIRLGWRDEKIGWYGVN